LLVTGGIYGTVGKVEPGNGKERKMSSKADRAADQESRNRKVIEIVLCFVVVVIVAAVVPAIILLINNDDDGGGGSCTLLPPGRGSTAFESWS
jgi:hypothetical protein